MAPFDFSTAGPIITALIFGAIGFGFGAVLELGGFGDTRKLAAQFYLRDLTVLKVMFTGIIVAATLVAGATALGLLDMSRVWVNPTYLWPGIVGGLVMGVGFVLGGFCPGTSLVAASTLKIDGLLFLAGALGGVWLFGETVGSFEPFFLSSAMGRFTLPEWLGLPLGVTLVLVVFMALGLFWAGELAELHFGQQKAWSEVLVRPTSPRKVSAAAVLVMTALAVAVHGQPSPLAKFERLGDAAKRPLQERAVFVHPGEVAALRGDFNLHVAVIDLRDEHDFNLFPLGGARRLQPDLLTRPEVFKPLLEQPASTVTFLMANGEEPAVIAWKTLRAQGVQNLYVLEGGVNRWLELYPVAECVAVKAAPPTGEGDPLAFRFSYASGSNLPAAWPELPIERLSRGPCGDPASGDVSHGGHGAAWPEYSYPKKVKLQFKAAVKGGCG